MTHHEQSNAFHTLVQLLAENGFDGMAQAIQILMNEALLLQRGETLQAAQRKSSEDTMLINSREAAKRLKVSQRTLWGMHNSGKMPPPIRIGRMVRWSVEVLKKWTEAGCPIDPEWQNQSV